MAAEKFRLNEQKPGPPETVGLFLPDTFPLPMSPGGSENVCPVGALETDGNQRIKNRTVSVPGGTVPPGGGIFVSLSGGETR
jgi:hypothetical protein